MEWVGSKTHLTETSEPDEIHLVTQVTTTLATQTDMDALDTVHATLAQQDLLPDEHLLDAGYVDAEALVSARQNLGAEKWCDRPSTTRKAAIQVRFSPTVCQSCPSQAKCTQAQNGARTITFLPQVAYIALQHARQAHDTPEFKTRYAQRSGIEGTISQAVRGFELRRARYIGLAKTHLQMIATATAMNLHRPFDCWEEKPRARTRTSPFAGLAPESARRALSWRAG
jgi:transposase